MSKRICPHCKSDRVYEKDMTLWRSCNDAVETINISNGDEWQCFDCLSMQEDEGPVEVDLYVCNTCGSEDVYFDAFVSVNDSADVRTYDACYCPDVCERMTSIVRHTEYLNNISNKEGNK